MNDLTKKQKGFVEDYIETGNGTEAALANYDTEDRKSASVIAAQNLGKVSIQKAIQEMLPDDLLGEKHLELLRKVDDKGQIDVQAVSKGLDMAYKLKGSYAAEKRELSGSIEVEATHKIKLIADELRRRNR